MELTLIFVCVCVCSLGPPCCEIGTAWLLLTLGTWLSSPMMRSKHGCRSSSTSLAGETETLAQKATELPLLTLCRLADMNINLFLYAKSKKHRVSELAMLACEGDKLGTRAAWHWLLTSIA